MRGKLTLSPCHFRLDDKTKYIESAQLVCEGR